MDFTTLNNTESMDLSDHIMKWLKVGSDQIVILILLIALLVKFVFFEERIEPKQLNAITQVVARTEKNDLMVPIIKVYLQHTDQCTQTEFEISDVQTISLNDEETLLINDQEQKQKLQQMQHTHQTQETEQEQSLHEPRSLDECVSIMKQGGAATLSDDEIISIVKNGRGFCPLYKIEAIIDNPERGVKLRRRVVANEAKLPLHKLDTLSYRHFDYTKVMNVCCENVIGYVEIPVGYAGPLLLDGVKYYVPMATTEGALVASTNRGCKVLSIDGVTSFVEDIGMTRAPCVKFTNVYNASKAKRWIDASENFDQIKTAFDATSRFARLQEILITIDGPQLYIRFRALTGDAMGMNMVSKGAESALRYIQKFFPDMQIISLSGNFCSDKKPAAVNWIRGRGKRVVCECIVKARDLRGILKTDAKTLVQCNKLKNMAGSAMAGSIGGNNAHAANMVTAIYIACGQDPAQNVTSSNCSTGMECCGDSNEDLYLTCTMPSLEVGTVGGGTGLPGQSACLDMLGVRGAADSPADNSKKLAQIICATVMAGELSLMAALVNSDLVKSHMIHNR